LNSAPVKKRREGVFGIAVLLAGLTSLGLCLMPILLATTPPERILNTVQQERFFFDLFGIIGGCWLLSWVSALNGWKATARLGQWLGIILLCGEEAILVGVLGDTFTHPDLIIGFWLAPIVVQFYLLALFLGFFTLPSLTQSGNLRLTGLGTLTLLLPWLVGREVVIAGAQYLHGLQF